MTSFTKALFSLVALLGYAIYGIAQTVTVTGTITPPSGTTYTTLGAAVAAISPANQTGRTISITIQGTTIETATAALSNTAGSWTSLSITPIGNATVSGNLGGVLFSLSSVANVRVDGLNTGGNSLTFDNSSTATTATTIAILNNSTSVRFLNCTIKGSNTNTTPSTGTVYIGTSTTSPTTGNSDCSFRNCDITASGTNLPYIAIFALGSSGKVNVRDTIINCTIRDYFNTSGTGGAFGISMTNFCNTWFIYGNSFYQTAPRSTSSSSAFRSIFINGSASNITIRKNIIGGSVASGQGLTTITSSAAANWYGISTNAITVTAGPNIIDSNFVGNVRFTTTAGTTGTVGSGNCIGISTGIQNVETVSYNTIRGLVCTTSNTTAYGVVKGIDIGPAAGVTINAEYNTIDSLFALGGSGVGHSVRAIQTGGAGGIANIRHNKIGTKFSQSIQAGAPGNTLAAGQEAVGIYTLSTNNAVIQNNEIANIFNAQTTATLIGNYTPITRGVEIVSTGTANVSFNNIHDIVSNTRNSSSTIINCSGINFAINSAVLCTVTADTIWAVRTTNSFTLPIQTAGISSRNSAGTHNISNCLIYNIRNTVTDNATCSGVYTTSQIGFNLWNNMIILGVGNNVGNALNGVTISGDRCNLYHNSIYIGGPANASTSCFATTSNLTSPSILQNNIFYNARTAGTTNYAIRLNSNANITSNYNNLYSATTNLANSGSNYTTLAAWNLGTGFDANSVNTPVQFVDSSNDLHLVAKMNCKLNGAALFNATYATDVDGQARPNVAPPNGPDIGCDEFTYTNSDSTKATIVSNPACAGSNLVVTVNTSAYAPTYTWSVPYTPTPGNVSSITRTAVALADAGSYKVTVTDFTGCTTTFDSNIVVKVCDYTWNGTTSTAWHTATNWTPNVVPNSCEMNVIIPSGTPNSPVISASDVTVRNVTIAANATLNLSGKNIKVCRNWQGGNSGSAYSLGNGRVIMESTISDTIAGNTLFDVLQINNSTGTLIKTAALVQIDSILELKAGTVTNSGTLRFLSNADDRAGTIDNFSTGFTGTITGNIEAQRYVPGSGLWQHYFSSPVNAVAVSQFGASGTPGFIIPTANCDETQSASGSPYGTMFRFHENQAASCALKGWESITSGNTDNARGYSVYKNGGANFTLTGAPNLASSYTVSSISNTGWAPHTSLQGHTFSSGWNLVGNPYLATMSPVASLHSANFNDADIAVWNASGPYAGTYSHYKMAGSAGVNPVAKLAPFQGFMVNKTTAGSGTYVAAKTELVHGTSTFYKNVIPVLQAEVNGNGFLDVTRIGFHPSATNNFDNGYDAQKFHSKLGQPTIFTLIGEMPSSGNVLKQLAEEESITVLMGVEPGNDGYFNISFTGIEDFPSEMRILLEDLKLRTVLDLREQPIYYFSAYTTDVWNRFRLHFIMGKKEDVVSGMTNADAMNVRIYTAKRMLQIDLRKATNEHYSIEIYNSLGQLLHRENKSGPGFHHIPLLELPSGVAYVQVTKGAEKIMTKKLVIE